MLPISGFNMAGAERNVESEYVHRGKKERLLKTKNIGKIFRILCVVTEMQKTVGKLVEVQGWGHRCLLKDR